MRDVVPENVEKEQAVKKQRISEAGETVTTAVSQETLESPVRKSQLGKEPVQRFSLKDVLDLEEGKVPEKKEEAGAANIAQDSSNPNATKNEESAPQDASKEESDAAAQFFSFDNMKDAGVTDTAPFFKENSQEWVKNENVYVHTSGQWTYMSQDDLFFHVPTSTLYKRPDPENVAVVPFLITEEEPAKSNRVQGKILWWNAKKGFGFISMENGGDDVFCHKKQLEQEDVAFKGLKTDDIVNFELDVINDKICAAKVRVGPIPDIEEDDDEQEKNESGEEEEEGSSDVDLDLKAGVHCFYGTKQGAAKDENQDRYIEKSEIPLMNDDADMIFTAVMDGHNGIAASEYIQNNWTKQICTAMENKKKTAKNSEDRVKFAFQTSLKVLDHNFMQITKKTADNAGTTVCGVALYGPDEDGALRLFTGHLGDSRAVLSRNGEAIRLTEDHKPDRPDELERIKKMGGAVNDMSGTFRVLAKSKELGMLGLAVSRAIGDRHFKEPLMLVSNVCETNAYNIDLDQDEFIVIASDGIFDVIKDQTLVNIVRKGMNPDEVIKTACNYGACDDCTVVIIRFGWNPKNQRALKKEAMRQAAARGEKWEGSDLEPSEDEKENEQDEDEDGEDEEDAADEDENAEDEEAEEAPQETEEEMEARKAAKKAAMLADMFGMFGGADDNPPTASTEEVQPTENMADDLLNDLEGDD